MAGAEPARTSQSGLRTIKRRADFLAVRGGARWAGPAFVIEAKLRPVPDGETIGPARFGLTVTKKLGNAVKRNRIRRRLKDAIRRGAIELAQPGFDYVVIAREQALVRAFNQIENDLRVALGKVHKEPPGANGPRRSHGPRGDKSNRPGREPGTDGGRI